MGRFHKVIQIQMPKTAKEILCVFGDDAHRHWVAHEATDEQLDEYIAKISGNELLYRTALAEREKRHFKRLSQPHWTLGWGFIVSVIAMVFAGIAAWPVIREWFQPVPPEHKDSSSQPPQSNSAPTKLAAPQTLPLATNAAP